MFLFKSTELNLNTISLPFIMYCIVLQNECLCVKITSICLFNKEIMFKDHHFGVEFTVISSLTFY